MQWLTNILPWIQVGLSVVLAVLILLQRSEAGLGTAFGDSGNAVSYTRRGAEKIIFRITIVIAVLFAVVSATVLVLK